MKAGFRSERDLLGEKSIQNSRYWGIHTERARDNFFLSGETMPRVLYQSLAMVKKAALLANHELGFIPTEKFQAMERACDEIIDGALADQFPLDSLQGGAGTSINMNVNEVIANRALEISGRNRGDYSFIHPIEDVNLHQSTNDVYPTAVKVASVFLLNALSEKLALLQDAFRKKEEAFSGVVTMGRTELQEAVPITLGAQFGAFSEAFARDRWRCFKGAERIRTVNLGGTAVGTGLTAPRRYIFLVIEKLREMTGLPLMRGENCIDQTANADAFVEVSAMLKACAVNFMKICRDLRLLHFTGEIVLPPVQAGSSIMPGKVNPVIMESLIQGSMKIFVNDDLVSRCASEGTLQINEFMPLLSSALLGSLEMLGRMAETLTGHVEGIGAGRERCRQILENSPGVMTAFLPHIGYDRASELIKAFSESPETSMKRFLERQLGGELVEKVLSPHNLISLGYRC